MSPWSFSLEDAAKPTVAVELAGRHVSAASVETHGRRTVVAAHATESLSSGALVPSLITPNLRDRAAVLARLTQVLERVGRPRRIGLVLPDPIAKVSILKFQHVPARERELGELIRWQLRKAAPFPLEEAQVSYVRGAHAADGQEFIVSLARREVVAEYEALCAEAGAHAGLVDLSTFNIVNAVLAGSTAVASDWLLVNVAPEWASLAILRGSNLIFFRSRSSEGDGSLADLVHQTAMYYEDRLNGSAFDRVLLCGAADAAGGLDEGAVRRSIEERLGTRVDAVDPLGAAALTDRIDASPALLDRLAPLVGLLVRGQEAPA